MKIASKVLVQKDKKRKETTYYKEMKNEEMKKGEEDGEYRKR